MVREKERKITRKKSGYIEPQLGFGRDQYVQEDYPTYNQCKSVKYDYTNILEIIPFFKKYWGVLIYNWRLKDPT